MKMKRYVAADMRSALRMIRDEQGPDAVILSSRPTAAGVEVCAAVDIELAIGQSAMVENAALKQIERATLQQLERGAVREAAEAAPQLLAPQPPAVQPIAALPFVVKHATPSDDIVQLSTRSQPVAQSVVDSSAIGEELRSLRGLLEQQLAALAWNDFTRREPLKARALTDLANLGLDRALARAIVDEMPADVNSEQAQRMPYALLGRRIQICAAPLERRGALALIGPPGSGKTTTLSKLATRYVLEQDAANLLIISADDDRLGAHEQMRSLGRLLGVRVESVGSLEEASARVAALPERAILVDTPGVACRDTAAATRYREWRAKAPAHLQAMLAVPASAQSGVIGDAVENFGIGTASCCVLTRLDEAVSLGGLLSSLAVSQLPVAYCCEGIRIPEDIRPARAHQLVARAIDLARQSQINADDDLLARRYGRNIHAAA
ncbi:MAG TPA: flagellar biosynthesis protein FlhF [Steroidobacteraceae bacterium]|jgi:flagellar biosynthesis protein FlhF|nr:flagellar biosynthesis protein FlhF [Steroidobacteraceae bacterium]